MPVYMKNGQHYVTVDGKKYGPFQTNSDAWRAHDKLIMDILSPQEGLADFRAKKLANAQ